MTESSTTPNNASKPTKAFSCVRCFERKVKCDKEHPCAGCVRSGVECIFRVPAPPRRKKKRTQEDILTERLNQYEQILQQKGIDVPDVPTNSNGTKPNDHSQRKGSVTKSDNTDGGQSASSPQEPDPRSFIAPKLIWEEGRSRFIENNLWTRVTEEFRAEQDPIHESSDEEDDAEKAEVEPEDTIDFTLGLTPASNSTRSFHPSPDKISVLWQIYLENVNPFSMVVHRPTMTITIEKAMQNLDHVPRGLEALMFAIYSAAVYSMQDHDAENTFGETRRTLLSRYRTATKAALSRAKFMGTSDIVVLQAFVIHLLSMRDVYDGRTLWTLSGVAIRIGEGMGLHKDGTHLGLPPFKTELRRRLWFQITTLDYRTAELSGTTKFRFFQPERINTKPPLNVNDADLWPGMTEFPTPHNDVTDMIICCLRYEFGIFWLERKTMASPAGGTIWDNYTSIKALEAQDEAIDELERRLETKFVRYCDPSIPVQLMTSIVARTATKSMRFMAHHPRRWATDAEMPEGESKFVWDTCMRIIDGYIMCITSKGLRRFIWHTSFYFQWQILIYVLDCLRADPMMADADNAWRNIHEIFDCHPNFITDTKKAIHVAVGNLCLKAYGAREEAFQRAGRFLPARAPPYIQTLRQQRDAAKAKQAERKARADSRNQSMSGPSTSVSNEIINMLGFEASPLRQNFLHQQSPQQQQPLPPFQVPTSEYQQQPQLAVPQDPLAVPAWFNNFNTMGLFANERDNDWMMMQDPNPSNQMDWTQWDFLLDDGGPGFGAIR